MSDQPTDSSPSSEIDRILDLVRQRAQNQVPNPFVTGLVVGGDTGELRIATRTGIVGISTAEVVRVVHPIPTRDDIATFYLSSLESLRSIFPVEPLESEIVAREPYYGQPGHAARAGSTFTHTATAGESMTAGEVAGVYSDDCEVHTQNDDSLD